MEAIVTIVGFLGAGKTTLLKHLTTRYFENGWSPFIILNDYENAYLDAQQFAEQLDAKWVKAFSGSCICCSGINELRDFVNEIPERSNGITLIEANGTTDACSLMGFLGVGLNDRFLPPVEVSVVNVEDWQKRGMHNELEANQVQVSSLIVLTHVENASEERIQLVINEVKQLNKFAEITTLDKIDISLLPQLLPAENNAEKLDHLKAHWSSCSTDLPILPDINAVYTLCKAIPSHILRVKGCTQIAAENNFTYFERTPDGKLYIRPYNGVPTTGAKLLTEGPGSEVSLLKKAIGESLITT